MASTPLSSRRSGFEKILSSVLSLALLLEPSFLAVAQSSFPLEGAAPVLLPSALQKNLGLPLAVGTVQAVALPQKSENGAVVFYIQDAHCNPVAQANIARIVETLVREEGVRLVCVEGAQGKVDASFIAEKGTLEKREQVAEEFMERGLLTGVEMLQITKSLDFDVEGVENRQAYLENFSALQDTLGTLKENEGFLQKSRTLIEKLKDKTFPEPLQKFDAAFQSYLEKSSDRREFILVLGATLEGQKTNASAQEFLKHFEIPEVYSNFKILLKAARQEQSIDFSKLEKEQARFWALLKTKVTPDSFKAWEKKSAACRDGSLSKDDFYSDIVSEIGSDPVYSKGEGFSGLLQYGELLQTFSKIGKQELLGEVRELAFDVEMLLAGNGPALEVVRLDQEFRVLDRLLHLKLTRSELQYYQDHKENFVPELLVGALQRVAKENGVTASRSLDKDRFALDVGLPSADAYYRFLLRRDRFLVQNLFQAMQERGQRKAVLIAGGFHSQGISEYVRDENAGIVTLSPAVGEATDLYYEVMMDPRMNLDEALSSLESGLAPVLLFDRGLGVNSAAILEQMLSALQDRSVATPNLDRTLERLQLETLTVAEKKRLLQQLSDAKQRATLAGSSKETLEFLTRLFGRVDNVRYATLEKEVRALKASSEVASLILLRSALDEMIARNQWHEANDLYQKFKSNLELVAAYPHLEEKIRQLDAKGKDLNALKLSEGNLNLINTGGHYHVGFPWKGKQIDVNVPGDGSCFFHAVAWGEIINQKTVPASIQTLDQLDQWLRTTITEKNEAVNERVREIRAQIAAQMTKNYAADKDRILQAIALEIGAMRQDNLRSGLTPDKWRLGGGLGGDNPYSQAYLKFFRDNQEQDILTSAEKGFNLAALKQLFAGKEQELDNWAKAYLAALSKTSMWAGTLEENVLGEIRGEQRVPLASIDVHNLHYGVEGENLVRRDINTLLWEGSYSSREKWKSEDVSSSQSQRGPPLKVGTGQFSTQSTAPVFKPVLTDSTFTRENLQALHPQPGKSRIADSREHIASNKRQIEERNAIATSRDTQVEAQVRQHPELSVSLEQAIHPRYGSLNKNTTLFRNLALLRQESLLDFFKTKRVLPGDAVDFTAWVAPNAAGILKSAQSQHAVEFQLPLLLEFAKLTNENAALTARLGELTVPEIQTFYSLFLSKISKGTPLTAEDQESLKALGLPQALTLRVGVDGSKIAELTVTPLAGADAFKALLIMEGAKAYFVQTDKDIRDLKARKQPSEVLSRDQQELSRLLLDFQVPESASKGNKTTQAQAKDLLRRIERHNWLKTTVRATFLKELTAEENERQVLLNSLVAEINKLPAFQAKPMPVQSDFSKIAELLTQEKKGSTHEIQTIVETLLQKSLKELQGKIKGDTRQASEKLLRDQNLVGPALSLINAAVSLGAGYPSLTEEQLMTSLGAFEGGQVMELATGEGKTAVSMVAGFLNALSGKPSLIVTTKESSAEDTHREASFAFSLLGMKIGLVQGNDKKGYEAAVTVVDTKRLHFDLLKDVLTSNSADKTQWNIPALDQAAMVVDEFDSVMIHQAQTEYIRSGESDPANELITNRELIRTVVKLGDGVFTKEWNQKFEDKKFTLRHTKYLAAYAVLRKFGPAADQSKEQQAQLWSQGDTWKNFGLTTGPKGLEMSDEVLEKLISTVDPEVKKLFADKASWKAFLIGQIQAYTDVQRGKDYAIYEVQEEENGPIQKQLFLVDYSTGVFLPSQRRHGVVGGGGGHTAYEIKEEIELGDDNLTAAALSPREAMLSFGKVSGITGTAEQTQESVAQIYGLSYRHIPTHNPVLRKDVGLRGQELEGDENRVLPVFHSDQERLEYLARSVIQDVRDGRPVLVFADNVQQSELLVQQLTAAIATILKKDKPTYDLFVKMGRVNPKAPGGKKYEPILLKYNAFEGQEKEKELNLVEHQSGQPGAITIVTNIGGRGTDFKLHGMAVEKGFHNYGVGPAEGSDIEAQRRGRAGRQGAMGTSEELISLGSRSDLKFLANANTPENREVFEQLMKDLQTTPSLTPALQRRVWQQILYAQEQIKKGKEKGIIDQIKLGEAKFDAQVRFAKFRREAMNKLEAKFKSMEIPQILDQEFERLVSGMMTSDPEKFPLVKLEKTLGERFGLAEGWFKDSKQRAQDTRRGMMKRQLFQELASQRMQNIVDEVQGEWFDRIQEELAKGRSQDDVAASIDALQWQEALEQRLNQGLGTSSMLDSIFKPILLKETDALAEEGAAKALRLQILQTQGALPADVFEKLKKQREPLDRLLGSFESLQDPQVRARLEKQMLSLQSTADSAHNLLWFSETLGLTPGRPSVRQAVFRAATRLSAEDLSEALKNPVIVARLQQQNWLAETAALLEAKLGKTLEGKEMDPYPQAVRAFLGEATNGLQFSAKLGTTPEERAQQAASKLAAQLLRHHTHKNSRWLRLGFRSTSWSPFQHDFAGLLETPMGPALQSALKNTQSRASRYLTLYVGQKYLFGVDSQKVRDFVSEVASRDMRRQVAEAKRTELLKKVEAKDKSGLIGGGNLGTAKRVGRQVQLTEEHQAAKTANVTSFEVGKEAPTPILSNLTREEQDALNRTRVELTRILTTLSDSDSPKVRELLGKLGVTRETLTSAADTVANRLFTFSKTQNSQGKFILGVGLETASQGEIGFDETFLKLLLKQPDLAVITLFHEALESITDEGKHNTIRELQKELFKAKDEELTHTIRSFNISRLLEGKIAADKQEIFRQHVLALLKKSEKTEADINLLVMHLLQENMDLSLLDSIFEAVNRSNSRAIEPLQPTPALLSNLYNEILQFKADAPTTPASLIRIQKLFEKLGLSSYESVDLMKAIQELTTGLQKPVSGPMELSRPLEALLGLLGGLVLEGNYPSTESKRAAAEKLAAALASMTGKVEARDKAQWVSALMDSSPNLAGLKLSTLSPETQTLFARLKEQKQTWSSVQAFRALESEKQFTFGPNLTLNKKGLALSLSLGKGSSAVEMDLAALQKKHGLTLKTLAQLQGAFKAAPELSKQVVDIRNSAAAVLKSSNALATGNRKSLVVVSENMSEQDVRQIASYFKSVVDAGVTKHHKLLGSRDSFLQQMKELGLFTDTFTPEKLSALFVDAVTPEFTEDKPLVVIGKTGLDAFAGLKKTIVLNSQDSLSAAFVGATAFLTQDKTLIQKLQATLSAPNADLTRLSDNLSDVEVNKLQAALTLRVPLITPLLEFALSRISDEEETILISG